MAYILQNRQGPVNEAAFQDCIHTILAEHQSGRVETREDLMAIREKMKERKGIRG